MDIGVWSQFSMLGLASVPARKVVLVHVLAAVAVAFAWTIASWIILFDGYLVTGSNL